MNVSIQRKLLVLYAVIVSAIYRHFTWWLPDRLLDWIGFSLFTDELSSETWAKAGVLFRRNQDSRMLMALDLRYNNQRYAYLTGRWPDKGIATVLNKYLKKGEVFVDVGAHIGIFTMQASSIVGESGSVFAFEPNPKNYSVLTGHVGINRLSNVTCYNAAAGRESKEGYLQCGEGESPLGALAEKPSDLGENSSVSYVRVPVVDIGEELGKLISSIRGIVKIDTEGYEYEVCQGLSNIINDQAELSFLVEVSGEWIKKISHVNPDDLLNIFRLAGYRLYVVDDQGNISLMEKEFTAWQYDLFATRRIID